MSSKPTTTNPSALQSLKLSFEYNETWAAAKKAVKDRTDYDS